MRDLIKKEINRIASNIYPYITVIYPSERDAKSHSIEGAIEFNLQGENTPVHKILFDDLYVIYGITNNERFTLIQEGQLADWKITNIELHEMALENFNRDFGKIITIRFMEENAGVVLLNSKFESSAILMHSIWRELYKRLNGDIVIGIPAKHIVMFAKRDDAHAIEEIRGIVCRYFANNRQSSSLLTNWLLKWNNKEWDRFEEVGCRTNCTI